MPSIVDIMQKRLMDTIRSVQPPGKWKIIVVDEKSTIILNAACRMQDILDENVMLVEEIQKKRQPYPTSEAIYFLTSCKESVSRFADDSLKNPPTYKAVHVYFTGGLTDELFDTINNLNSRLKSKGVENYIMNLKELYVDFIVNESAVFTVDPITSFLSVFGRSNADESLKTSAKQLLSVCATLGEDPIIRFQTQSEDGMHPHSSPAGQLAKFVSKEMDNFCRLNPNFPPIHNPPRPRATLLIVDRSIDPAAPLLHEFTYQAMINDLLPIEDTPDHKGIRYSYEFHQADGSMGKEDVLLNEEDDVYKSIRHMHIGECSSKLVADLHKFLEENREADGPKTTEKKLKDMKDMLINMPQYQDQKKKSSAHTSIAQDCMSYFERHKLNSVGNLEQNMATGETADGETPKTIVLDMVPLLDDPHISPEDKTRLLMLYIIWKEGGIFEDDKKKLVEHAKLNRSLRAAIDNLPLLGVKLTRVRKPEKSSFIKKRRQKRNKDEEVPYELSRYVPTLKKVMDAQLTNTLDPKQFAFVRAADMGPSEDGNIPPSGVSLRTTKSTWSKNERGNSGSIRASNGAKLIVFVIGGATYSEIRSVYEIAENYGRDIYLGTTELLRPSTFVRHLGDLQSRIQSPPSLITPYTPPPKPTEHMNKTTALMSQIHINGSSSTVSKNTSPMLSEKSSVNSAPSEEKEKEKKKKGLWRLF